MGHVNCYDWRMAQEQMEKILNEANCQETVLRWLHCPAITLSSLQWPSVIIIPVYTDFMKSE